MGSDEAKQNLKELFPHLTDVQADNLAKSGDDLNILITRVLDNNIEAPTFEIKELAVCKSTKYKPVAGFNYPEVFENACRIDMHLDIKDLRSRAAKLNQEASDLTKKAIAYEIKQARYHFSIGADEKREEAAELNRKAALILMRKCVEAVGPVDLHGFTVKEAGMFMDDLLKFRKFARIELVTGQAYNSSRIRPAMKEWFERNEFYCCDQGPCLLAIRKDLTYFASRY